MVLTNNGNPLNGNFEKFSNDVTIDEKNEIELLNAFVYNATDGKYLLKGCFCCCQTCCAINIITVGVGVGKKSIELVEASRILNSN